MGNSPLVIAVPDAPGVFVVNSTEDDRPDLLSLCKTRPVKKDAPVPGEDVDAVRVDSPDGATEYLCADKARELLEPRGLWPLPASWKKLREKTEAIVENKIRAKKAAPNAQLIVSDEELAELKARAASDPLLKRMLDQLSRRAEIILKLPPIERKVDEEEKDSILDICRECFAKVTTLALAFRLTNDARFARRAIEEMKVAAGFEDWNPGHFLDIATMTAALAIGSSWLSTAIRGEDRALIRRAIAEKGLKPGMAAYDHRDGKGWWADANSNWNAVCNGGLALGALAMLMEGDATHIPLLAKAIVSLPQYLEGYRDDGGGFEGPNYWRFGITHAALMIDGLSDFFGSDFDLNKSRGFERTGDFRQATVGTCGDQFSFADSDEWAGIAYVMFWLASTFGRPQDAAFEAPLLMGRLDRFDRKGKSAEEQATFSLEDSLYPLAIAWYGKTPEAAVPALTDALFRQPQSADVAILRGDSESDIYVGFKGGNNRLSHAHMDIGSFVLDALGKRWAVDLGWDNYGLEGYFEDQRWDYFRTGSKSHNTIVIDDKLQSEKGKGRITRFHSEPGRSHAVVDMKRAYRGQVDSLMRGIAVLDGRQVLVQDEIALKKDGTVRWGMVTPAEIELKGSNATLTIKDAVMEATILEPVGAKFEMLPTKPANPKENPNEGTAMLAVRIKVPEAANKAVVIRVLFTPRQCSGEIELPPEAFISQPLESWDGPVIRPNESE